MCGAALFYGEIARIRLRGNFIFSNTPPISFTKNGKGYCSEERANLREDAYGLFADYLADVAEHFSKEGYNVRYISPINEPQGGWLNCKSQEG